MGFRLYSDHLSNLLSICDDLRQSIWSFERLRRTYTYDHDESVGKTIESFVSRGLLEKVISRKNQA